MDAADEPLAGLFYNGAVVAGLVSRYGVRTTFQDNGAQRTSFTVEVHEVGFDAKVRRLYLEIESWGKAAEAAGLLEAGQPVIVEGKLARTQRTKKGATEPEWYTTVQVVKVQVLDDITKVTPTEAR